MARFLLLLILLFSGCDYSQGQRIVTVHFERSGKPLKKVHRGRIVIYLKGKAVSCAIKNNEFVVPDLENCKVVGVCIYAHYRRFIISYVADVKFETNWTVGYDFKPFIKDIQSISPSGNYVNYIKYSDGTEVVAQFNRRFHLW